MKVQVYIWEDVPFSSCIVSIVYSLLLKGDWPFCLPGLLGTVAYSGNPEEFPRENSRMQLVHQTHLVFLQNPCLEQSMGFIILQGYKKMFTECRDKYCEARKHALRRTKKILCHWLLRWEPPSKYWSITPGAGVMGLATICNSTLRGSSASFWLLKALHGCGAQTYMQAKYYIQKESYFSFLYMVFKYELVPYQCV